MKDVKHRRWAGHQQSTPVGKKVGPALVFIFGLMAIIFLFAVSPYTSIKVQLPKMPSAKTLVQNEIGRINNAAAKDEQKARDYLRATSASDHDVWPGIYEVKVGGVEVIMMANDFTTSIR